MVDKVLHAQMPFTTGKQTINDRLTAAYHSLAGSQLGKTVCKATTEEEMGPKKKHLDYLIHCTNEPNVSIPQLANLLVERTTSANWCTVFKSLISLHNLMCYGNERFSQYLASANANFNLGNFLDKTCVQGYDMSTHVRRYAKYIGEKIFTYRVMAFDFCKVKRGREDGLLRTMPTDRLLKSLPLLQGQIDSLLEFQVSTSDLTNGVINSCFILLFRDLIRLFACYNDGVINLLEKYFDMNKKQCRDALELYKNFLTRMDKVADFLKVAESVGIDKCEIPDLARAPSSLIEALEQHLASLEGQKVSLGGSSGSRVASPTSGPSYATQSAIKNLSSSGGFASPVVDPASLDEQSRNKILQEEEQRLNMLKEQRMRELHLNQDQQIKQSPVQNTTTLGYPAAPKTNPFLQTPINDASAKSSSIDDLLSLDFSSSTGSGAVPPNTNPFQSGLFGADQFGAQSVSGSLPFRATAYTNGHSLTDVGAGFTNDDAFARAFTTSIDATKSGGYGSTELQVAASANFNPFLTDVDQPPAAPSPPSSDDEGVPSRRAAMEPSQPGLPHQMAENASRTGQNVALNPFEAFQQNAQAFLTAGALHVEVVGDTSAETPSPQPPYGGLSPVPAFENAFPDSPFTGMQAQMRQATILPDQLGHSQHGTPKKMSGGLHETQFIGSTDENTTKMVPQQSMQQHRQQGPGTFEPAVDWSGSGANFNMQPQQKASPYAANFQPQQKIPGGFMAYTEGLDNAPVVSMQQMPSNKSNVGKVLKGDLDSSLASLAQNLNISKGQDALKNKPVQWNQQKPASVQNQQYQTYGSSMTHGHQQPMVPSWGQQPQMPAGVMPGTTPNTQYYGQQMPMYPAQMGAMSGNMNFGIPGAPQQMVRPPANFGPMPADPFGTL